VIAELADSHRNEIGLEEQSGRFGIKPPGSDGAAAHLFERGAYRPGIRRGVWGLKTNRPHAGVGLSLNGALASGACKLKSNRLIALMDLGGLRGAHSHACHNSSLTSLAGLAGRDRPILLQRILR
jgi:hypothetical protein